MKPDAPPSAFSAQRIAYTFTLAFIGAVAASWVIPAWGLGIGAGIGFGFSLLMRKRIAGWASLGIAGGTIASTWPLGSLLHVPSATGLISLRGSVQSRIGELYPEPHGSLLMGLLTGDRSGLPYDIVQDFRTTGLSHILAVSGFNITLIISMLMSMLFFLPIRWRLIPAGVGVILFVLFVGPSASVVRAAVMGIIGLVAIATQRISHARLSILWAAVAMLIWQPSWLKDDAGFQLSFLAVIGLTELSETIKPYLRRVPEVVGMRDALLATLAAQATATPWSTVLFGSVPMLSPLANVLAAPLIAPAMMLGGISVMASWIWEPLGLLLSAVTWLLLAAILIPSQFLAAVPYAAWDPGKLTPWLAGIWYLWLLWRFLRSERRKVITSGTNTISTDLRCPVPSPLPIRGALET